MYGHFGLLVSMKCPGNGKQLAPSDSVQSNLESCRCHLAVVTRITSLSCANVRAGSCLTGWWLRQAVPMAATMVKGCLRMIPATSVPTVRIATPALLERYRAVAAKDWQRGSAQNFRVNHHAWIEISVDPVDGVLDGLDAHGSQRIVSQGSRMRADDNSWLCEEW